jgi:putative Mg2+ transporter-C (MgtC) family protein
MSMPTLATPMLMQHFLIALALGAAIGLERRLNGHVAGIHTYSMVSLGSCMFAFLGSFEGHTDVRVLAQVVTGIGFLCSGVIIHDGVSVRGLNTAVSIWCSAAIGCLVAVNEVTVAWQAALLVVVANAFLHMLERAFPLLLRPIEEQIKIKKD